MTKSEANVDIGKHKITQDIIRSYEHGWGGFPPHAPLHCVGGGLVAAKSTIH